MLVDDNHRGFQQLFDRPPAALRRAGATATEAGEGRGGTLRLAYRAPYDWDAILDFLALRAIPGVEAVRDGRYRRSLRLGGEVGVGSVARGPGEVLEVEARFPRLTVLPQLIARVRRVFDLGADPAAIGEHLAKDPALAPLVAARPGLRAPGAWDGFELAVRALLRGGEAGVLLAAGVLRDVLGHHVVARGHAGLPPAHF